MGMGCFSGVVNKGFDTLSHFVGGDYLIFLLASARLEKEF